MKWLSEIYFHEKYERVHNAILLSSSCVLLLILSLIPGYFSNISGDSITFIEASNNLFNGKIDALRTPIYPIICHISLSIFHSYFAYAIVALQAIVYLYSQIYLYKALSAITGNRKVAFLMTLLLYSLQPCVASWCFDIMAESLSVSCVVFFFYHITKLKTSFKGHCLAAFAMLFIMLFLKPAFLCLVPVTFLFFFYSSCHKSFLTSCLTALSLAIVIYCLAYQVAYGRFGFSYVSSFNRAIILTDIGKYNHYGQFDWKPYNIGYEAKGYNKNNCYNWRWNVTNNEMAKCDSIYFANLILVSKCRLAATYNSKSELFPSPGEDGKFNEIYKRTSLPLLVYYIILFGAVCLQAHQFFRCRTLSRIALACIFAIAAIQFTAIWGAQNELPRLMLPMYPIYIFLLASCIQNLRLLLQALRKKR